MAELLETSEWTPGIYQLETTDPVEGGPEGVDNLQARQLANRTAYLKTALAALGEGTQPLDATLTALAAIATVADRLIYATGVDAFATTTLTAFARTLLDDVDAAAARATLGIVAGTETAAGLLELATAAETITGTDAVRATHAAGTKAAIDAAIDAAITALVNGSPAALNQLNELAAALGNDPNFATTITTALASKQPLDATLTALAAMATAANQLIYATGSDTFETTALTAFARTLLDDADAATARATLGIAAGTETAAGVLELATAAETITGTDAVRATHAAGTKAAIDAAITALVNGSPAALNQLNELATALGNDPNFATTITTALASKQPLDATLTALAAMATAANQLIYATGSDTFGTTALTAFARTLLDDADAATARATLGIVAGTETAAGLLELATAAETITGTDAVRATHAAGVKAAIGGIESCKAWVNINGSGTVAVRASKGVSSVTDNGIGDYTVNLSTPMPDENYALTAMTSHQTNTALNSATSYETIAPRSANQFRVVCTYYSGGGTYAQDPTHLQIALLR